MAELLSKVFSYNYLSKKDLKGFDSYKYSAIDTSPLSNYVMHPLWNRSIKINECDRYNLKLFNTGITINMFKNFYIPANIAPNLITFIGFLFMMLNVLLLTILDYNMTSSGKPPGYIGEVYHLPNWIFTLCGVMLFLAYNLDGIDGKQARKLGVSGPLGEMFDHGLDSYVVFFIPYCLTSVFGRDLDFSLPTFRGFLIIMSITLNFYVSHWEKYNTGTLYLPWGYDLSMWVASALFIVAGLKGPSYLKFYVFRDISFVQVFEVVIHATGFFTTLPIAIYNVYLFRQSKSGHSLSFLEAMRPVWSMLVMNILMVSWALQSSNDIVNYDPKAFMLLYGNLFSHIASRLIVSGMCGQRCDLVSWLNFPLAAGATIAIYFPQLELPILYSLFLLTLIAHVHYGVCVVRQMCTHFKISCFTVPRNTKTQTKTKRNVN